MTWLSTLDWVFFLVFLCVGLAHGMESLMRWLERRPQPRDFSPKHVEQLKRLEKQQKDKQGNVALWQNREVAKVVKGVMEDDGT